MSVELLGGERQQELLLSSPGDSVAWWYSSRLEAYVTSAGPGRLMALQLASRTCSHAHSLSSLLEEQGPGEQEVGGLGPELFGL